MSDAVVNHAAALPLEVYGIGPVRKWRVAYKAAVYHCLCMNMSINNHY